MAHCFYCGRFAKLVRDDKEIWQWTCEHCKYTLTTDRRTEDCTIEHRE